VLSGGSVSRLGGACLAVLALAVCCSNAAAAASVRAISETPTPVASGSAEVVGAHPAAGILTLNVDLTVRNQAGLRTVIAAAGNPASPDYGRYLTQAEYLAGYAPTDAEVAAATDWLGSQGVTITGVSKDNLLIHASAPTATIERAFHVRVRDYVARTGRSYFANDRDPVVPAYLRIHYVGGLSDYQYSEPATTCTPSDRCGFEGNELRKAYDYVGNGEGQTIGFTLWGKPIAQANYTEYAKATGTTPLTVGGSGNNGLTFIQVGKASTETEPEGEIALDTEMAHAVAPGVHETYWLGEKGNTTIDEETLDEAANSSIKVISDSWTVNNAEKSPKGSGEFEPCEIDSSLETIFEHGAATGKTFYFASGDSGASHQCAYPDESDYVVSVGGTKLPFIGEAGEEEAIENGGGCLPSQPRPSWQVGIGTTYSWGPPQTVCNGRAEPDVSANSGDGAYLFEGGKATCCTGGTSLATPLWAAGMLIFNKHNLEEKRPGIGFAAPLIYSIANDEADYKLDFHDITKGTNGFAARPGWDEATGWGSPDFNNLSNNKAEIVYTGPTQASEGEKITLSGNLYDKGTTHGLEGRTITFTLASQSCKGSTSSNGSASCELTVKETPKFTSVTASFAGDVAYDPVSLSTPFTILHIPTQVTYTGSTTGVYNTAMTLSGKLIEVSTKAGLGHQQLKFKLGKQSCEGETNASGEASCKLTPLEPSGKYTLEVSFAESTVFRGSTASVGFTLETDPTEVTYTGPTAGVYNTAMTLSGKLVEKSTKAPLAHQQLKFKLGKQSCEGETNSGGEASCKLTPLEPSGKYTLEVSFAETTLYRASSAGTPFTLEAEATTLEAIPQWIYTAPPGGVGPDYVAAYLWAGGAPVEARTIVFSLPNGNTLCSAVTSSSGYAVCKITSSQEISVIQAKRYRAKFAGDAYYKPSSAETPIDVF
jgi:Pro-kumamolisin, activation domain/Subtilase family